MSIELRPFNIPRADPGDLDEVVATNASVHLETLSDNAIMLIVEDEQRHVHLQIFHGGRSPIRVRVYEEWNKT
mgnify:CR=1 FL=1